MMDLFEDTDTDELKLEDLPTWQDFKAVQEWKEDLAEARKEVEEAESRMAELRQRKARQITGDVVTTTTETLRRVAEGPLEEKMDDARQAKAKAQLKVQEVKGRREEAYAEAREELLEEVDERLEEGLEDFIEALRQFGRARQRLSVLNSWTDRLNRKHGETSSTNGPAKKPYNLQGIPSIGSPIPAEKIAQNLQENLEAHD